MNHRLLGIGGPLKGTEYPLDGREVSIGRDSSNQLCVADAALSRRHCVVIAEGEKFSIRDLGSRNGTLVNGVPVETQREIRPGDQIYIGDSVLVFLLEEGGGISKTIPSSSRKPGNSTSLRFCCARRIRFTCSRINWLPVCLQWTAAPVT